MTSKAQFNFALVAAFANELISQKNPKMTRERYSNLRICKRALESFYFDYGFIGDRGDVGRILLNKLVLTLEEMRRYFKANGRKWEKE